MSWALNQGPSFNNIMQPQYKLNGFYQRFQLTQDDNRMTPGKREPVNKTDNLRKGSKGKRIKYTDSIPKGQPQPIYSGFANIKNKTSTKIKKKGGKLKKRTVR